MNCVVCDSAGWLKAAPTIEELRLHHEWTGMPLFSFLASLASQPDWRY